MKKRVFSLFLALAVMLTFCGCTQSTTEGSPAESADVNGSADEDGSGSDYETQLFGKDVITINITADAEDWQYLLDNASSKPYIHADVSIDGAVFTDVGIKTKGNSSLTQISKTDTDRYSLKINFGKYVKGQNCYGLDDLVLNNLYCDTSYLKEYMSYELLRYLDVPASLCTYADIYVNGEHFGFYIAIEDVNESYLKRNYGEYFTGEAYKPESFDMDDGFGNIAASGNGVNNAGFGNMQIDITTLFSLKDADGNAVEWTTVLPEGFDSSSIATIAYDDGTTAEFSIRTLMSADLSAIAGLTDENGVSADLSAYTLSTNFTMPEKGGNENGDMPQMTDGKSSNAAVPSTTDSGDITQMPNGEDGGNAAEPVASDDGGSTEPSATDDGSARSPGMNGNRNNASGMDGGSLGVNLVYSDDEVSSYSNIFDNAITDVNESDEQSLIATLKAISEGENLEDYINVDEILRYAAVNVFLVNLDSYFSSMGHNYILYDDNGKLSMLPWDYNLSFGTYSAGSATDAVNYAIDTVFSGVSAEERPVIGLLLENEEYLARYHEYLSELVDYVTSGAFTEKVNAVSAAIDGYVSGDPTSFEGYDAFLTGVTALKNFATLRAQSVTGQVDGSIPATEDAQTDSDALIDASDLNLNDLGGMRGGNDSSAAGGFGGGNGAFPGNFDGGYGYFANGYGTDVPYGNTENPQTEGQTSTNASENGDQGEAENSGRTQTDSGAGQNAPPDNNQNENGGGRGDPGGQSIPDGGEGAAEPQATPVPQT